MVQPVKAQTMTQKVEAFQLFLQGQFIDFGERVSAIATSSRAKASRIFADKSAQATAASAAGGAAVLGAGGAAAGVAVAGATGLAFGLLPALFTFGLSIPLGGAIGAGIGLVAGGTVGTAAGIAGGGAAGYGAYQKSDEIKSGLSNLRVKFSEALNNGKSTAFAARDETQKRLQGLFGQVTRGTDDARIRVGEVYGYSKDQAVAGALKVKEKTAEIVSDKACQVSAASAASGAVAVGAGGAASGFFAGGAIGAAVGVVPAIFTFGLSIPVFAAIGSGVGTAAGAVTGGSAGFVAGGAAGYGAYSRRETISSGVDKAWSKADDAAKYMKKTASHSTEYIRARFPGATGGTMD